MIDSVYNRTRDNSQTVVNCYDFFDRLFADAGFMDLTEGMYHGDPDTPYAEAQRNQHNWLLDQIDCGPGSRILDIGCGNGTLLEVARERGANGVGITISPAQVSRARRRGLDVRLIDFRELNSEDLGYFDGIIANGSIEHFVQPEEVCRQEADLVYRTFFAICHRLLDPRSSSRKIATTVIHQNTNTPVLTTAELRKGPWAFKPFSPKFHYALLQQSFGGYYPRPGQLSRCAKPLFQLAAQVDGTEDYRLTSEAWFGALRRKLLNPVHGARLWPRLLAFLARHPVQGPTMMFTLFGAQSWQRQFRGKHPPTTLMRQVWQLAPKPSVRRYESRVHPALFYRGEYKI